MNTTFNILIVLGICYCVGHRIVLKWHREAQKAGNEYFLYSPWEAFALWLLSPFILPIVAGYHAFKFGAHFLFPPENETKE